MPVLLVAVAVHTGLPTFLVRLGNLHCVVFAYFVVQIVPKIHVPLHKPNEHIDEVKHSMSE
jgi:hypothetical protein